MPLRPPNYQWFILRTRCSISILSATVARQSRKCRDIVASDIHCRDQRSQMDHQGLAFSEMLRLTCLRKAVAAKRSTKSGVDCASTGLQSWRG